MARWVKYLLIRYEHLGRSWESGDCYNLVMLFFQTEFDIALDDSVTYSEDWAEDGFNHILDNTEHYGFSKVDRLPKLGDLVLFKYRGYVYHCGVSLGDGQFLHTHKRGTSVHDLTSGTWAARLHSVHKHRGLT